MFSDLGASPVAIGANCGVGAPDILVSVLAMTETSPYPVVSKGNCGVPQFQGAEIVYSGTPELMARYAVLAADAGARIVGGCCGTTPEHLAAMRAALDAACAGRATDRRVDRRRRRPAGQHGTERRRRRPPASDGAPADGGPAARQDGERRRSPYMPPSTASTVPVVDADCGDAR